MICLSSAGNLAWLQIKLECNKHRRTSMSSHEVTTALMWSRDHMRTMFSFKIWQESWRSLALRFWSIIKDTLKQAYQQENLPVPVAFENLMTHSLQFALLIALSCVLHRYGSQDIHRWNFLVFVNGFSYILLKRFDSLKIRRPWSWLDIRMILPQVHLRKPCYDFFFL